MLLRPNKGTKKIGTFRQILTRAILDLEISDYYTPPKRETPRWEVHGEVISFGQPFWGSLCQKTQANTCQIAKKPCGCHSSRACEAKQNGKNFSETVILRESSIRLWMVGLQHVADWHQLEHILLLSGLNDIPNVSRQPICMRRYISILMHSEPHD